MRRERTVPKAKPVTESRRQAACVGKFKHATFTAARNSMQPELRKHAMAYRCQVCHGWHIGSTKHKRAGRLAKVKNRNKLTDEGSND